MTPAAPALIVALLLSLIALIATVVTLRRKLAATAVRERQLTLDLGSLRVKQNALQDLYTKLREAMTTKERRHDELQQILDSTRAISTRYEGIIEAKTDELAQVRAMLHAERTHTAEVGEQAQDLAAQLAATKATLVEAERSFQEQKALLAQMQQQVKEEFAVAANKAVQDSTAQVQQRMDEQMKRHQQEAEHTLKQREQSFEQLVNPIKEQLTQMGQTVHNLEKTQVAAQQSIADNLKNVQQTTTVLSRSLRTPTGRGQWGEMQLKNIVELAGMQEHCDYSTQATYDTEEGKLRPDMLIRLPGDKVAVVDAKVPLDAYLNAQECEDPAEQQRLLKDHVRQTKAHIDNLADKAYCDHLVSSPDFVVCFLPNEAVFAEAMRQDPTLIEYGAKKNVVLACPTTLIAIVRSIAYGWRQQQLAENAARISKLGTETHDRIAVLAGYFELIRKGLDKANEGYNKAVASLESRLLVTVRKFPALGVETSKELTTPEPIAAVLKQPTADELLPVASQGDGAARSGSSDLFLGGEA
ncbi:MAG: DNA recombination protein RmuC [Bacteroidota bacterium]